MSPVAIVLVVAAAFFHAGWNRLLHDVEDRVAAMAVAMLTGALLLLPAIATSPPVRVAPLVGLSAALEAGYALCLAAAYRRGALSLAYPIGRGTAPLLTTLAGWPLLLQRPGPLTVAGAAALGLGLLLLATAGGRHRQYAIGFATLTGCCIAAYSLVDARAVKDAFPPAYLGTVLGLSSLLLFLFLRGQWARVHQALRPGALIGIGTTGSYLLVLFAFREANAGPVATLREVSVLIGLMLARERPGVATWIGGVLVVAGAILAAR